jgi:hypothetical protein
MGQPPLHPDPHVALTYDMVLCLTCVISIILVYVISCDKMSHVRYTLEQREFTYDTYVKSKDVEEWKEDSMCFSST